MKKGLQFKLNEVRNNKVINQKKRIKSAKKWKIEDKMITRIRKSINDFTQDKFNLSNHKDSSKMQNNIKSNTEKNNDKIYLTQLNILNSIKPFTENESTKVNFTSKKESIPLPPPITKENIIFSYFNKSQNSQRNSANNINIRFNTEENISNNNKNKKYLNHSYKNPLTLIKQEKYKIFEKKHINNKYNIDYLSESIERMRELKKIYSCMKQNSSPFYRNKTHKKI